MKSLLELLECPFLKALSDPMHMKIKEQILIISWLEDRFIRELEIAERDSIRPTNTSATKHIGSYLKRLYCPFAWDESVASNNLDAVNWVISHGVHLKFEDEVSAMEAETAMEQEEDTSEASALLDKLAQMLQISRKGGESNCELVKRTLESIKASCGAKEDIKTDFSLDDFVLGFETGDPTVNDIVKVLKMLYISDFRVLQDDVNEILAKCQQVSANPHLNTALGRVGR